MNKNTTISKIFQYLRPISISLSPNTERDDIWLAFKTRMQPWRWKDENAVRELEKEFAQYLGVKYAYAFNSGRSALMAILEALGLRKGEEILLQAFTCNAVPNPVLWAGLKPVYVDCREDDFNMDPADLEKKITQQSRAVIVQHTFGLPADLERIEEICRRRNLVLIEDCAHALGARYRGQLVGTFGKTSFFSFSRDKVISSVYGGMVGTNDKELAKRIQQFQQKIGYPSFFWIFQQLQHPLLMNVLILPTYKLFGKYLLVLFQRLSILSKAVHWKEKRGEKPGYFPKRMPGALAVLALHQFRKLERLNTYRRKIAAAYLKALENTRYEIPDTRYKFPEREHIFLRFPVRHEKAHEIMKEAWSRNLLVGDWYTSPVAPDDTKLEAMQYGKGSCPVAEKLAKTTFNLPTHINISEKDIRIIVDFLNMFHTRLPIGF